MFDAVGSVFEYLHIFNQTSWNNKEAKNDTRVIVYQKLDNEEVANLAYSAEAAGAKGNVTEKNKRFKRKMATKMWQHHINNQEKEANIISGFGPNRLYVIEKLLKNM